jgi:hypothetical protein
MEVDVEVLDVNDAEARALLLRIDPLAELAVNQQQLQIRLLELTPTVSPGLLAMWEASAAGVLDRPHPPRWRERAFDFTPQFYVLITCRDERHQRELLERFQTEGLDCQAKLG